MRKTKTIQTRLWENSQEIEGGCRVWTLGHSAGGYGKIKVDGVTRSTHRIAYETWIGAIPEGMCVLHRCDNPPCINPDHLFLGTHADNADDREDKGRGRRIHGADHANSVLNERDVREIKFAFKRGVPQYLLADIYRVSNGTIRDIIVGRTWGHIAPGDKEDLDVDTLLFQARCDLHRRMAMIRKRGEKHGRAKLTAEKVREIRAEFAGGRSKSEIARMYEVGWATVRDILNGKNWSHVE